MHPMSAALAVFRVEGATRGQAFLRGVFLSLAAPGLFFLCNAATHHWPHLFADRTMFGGSLLALTAELVAVRNFQRTFGGFNWMSAASFMLAVCASLFAFVMSAGIVEFLYYHMSGRYDTLSMVIALLLGIAALRGIFGVRWQKRKYTRLEIAALCILAPPTVLVFALTAWAIFREIFPK